MRYSGHEWFPCRYAWLPKAVRALADDPGALRDTEGAVERLGIGKNMVRALVFWATAMGVIEPRPEPVDLTEYLKDRFESFYSEFLLNFEMSQLMTALVD